MTFFLRHPVYVLMSYISNISWSCMNYSIWFHAQDDNERTSIKNVTLLLQWKVKEYKSLEWNKTIPKWSWKSNSQWENWILPSQSLLFSLKEVEIQISARWALSYYQLWLIMACNPNHFNEKKTMFSGRPSFCKLTNESSTRHKLDSSNQCLTVMTMRF